jgi:hypothetical protein
VIVIIVAESEIFVIRIVLIFVVVLKLGVVVIADVI